MTGFEFRRLVEVVLFPPGSIILLGLFVLTLFAVTRRCKLRWLYLLVLLLWMLSTPWFSFQLLDRLQTPFSPLVEVPADADVIVLLSGGHYLGANEFGNQAMPNGAALERTHYAAWLARKTGLPIITTGGSVTPEEETESSILAEVLRGQLGVEQILEENRSTNTEENAKFTREIMRENGFRKPLLVTHYWHMSRSIKWFRYFGIEAYAAPTARYARGPTEQKVWQWVPQARSLNMSSLAVHEYLGALNFRYRLFTAKASKP
jgi:uncharacterized SAM-binding protein YcdF (DUF218 family)